jgi:hypothetical protein
VTLTFLIVLATAHLEDVHFVVLAMSHHGGFDCGAGHQGRADLEFSAGSDSQNLINHDFLANVRSNLFYFNFFASDNTILFATGFYDRVHINDLFEWKFPRANPQGTGDSSTQQHNQTSAPSCTPSSGKMENALPIMSALTESPLLTALAKRATQPDIPFVCL